MLNQLDSLNKQITDLTNKRNDLLRVLRSKCNHLKLVELNDAPPKRMCVDCGAEERGWYCGYQVLVMKGDSSIAPHKNERVLVEITADTSKFYGYRKAGPVYCVGQSHSHFAGGGLKTYEQLTEVLQ